jgi:WD40 repeat protein
MKRRIPLFLVLMMIGVCSCGLWDLPGSIGQSSPAAPTEEALPTKQVEDPAKETSTTVPTITPSGTPTETPQPTITPLPSATPTATGGWPVQQNTPLPKGYAEITGDNFTELVELAVWGLGAAHDLAISPDGTEFAIATTIGVYFYDTDTMTLIRFLPTEVPVLSLDYANTQDLIALGLGSFRIHLYDRETLTRQDNLGATYFHQSKIEEEFTLKIRFSQDDVLAAHLKSGPWEFIRTWEVNEGKDLIEIILSEPTITFLDLNEGHFLRPLGPNLKMESLRYESDYSLLRLPELESGKLADTGLGFSISPDGTFVMVTDGQRLYRYNIAQDQFVYSLDVSDEFHIPLPYPAPTCLYNGEPVYKLQPQFFKNVSFHHTPNSAGFLSVVNLARTIMRQASTGRVLWNLETGYSSVDFSPDSTYLIGVTAGGTIEKRAVADGALLEENLNHPAQFLDSVISPDDSFIVLAGNNGIIYQMDLTNGAILNTLRADANVLVITADGQHLIAGTKSGEIIRFDLNTGEEVRFVHRHTDLIQSLDITPDGEEVLSGGNDCTVWRWDTDTGQPVKRVYGGAEDYPLEEPALISFVAYFPEDFTMYVGGDKGRLFLFSPSQGRISLDKDESLVTPYIHFIGNRYLAFGVRMDAFYTLNLFGSGIWHGNFFSSNVYQQVVVLNDDSHLVRIDILAQELVFNPLVESEETPCLPESIRQYTGILPEWTTLDLNHTGSHLIAANTDGFIHLWGIPAK